ncbi:hypothetical protein QQ045_020697 [Rhodiola kirilowii]
MESEDSGAQEPTIAQDGSIFNLTLDEVQSQLDSLGKPLSSMNLEELVRTVRTADSNKVLGTENDLGAKTVSEVWSNIQQGHTENNCEDRTTSSRCQPTLGELTLEDFLAKAGIVDEAPTVEENNRNMSNNAHNGLPKPATWTQVQHRLIQQPVCQPPMLQCTNMVPVFLPGHHHAHQTLPMTITYPQTQTSLSSPQSADNMSDTPSIGRKRIAMGDIDDKPAERRHRRMIKNRESAARSRERKQAYTQQLELKLAELEEENKKLKADEAPTPRPQPPNTKHQLRRTGSAPL